MNRAAIVCIVLFTAGTVGACAQMAEFALEGKEKAASLASRALEEGCKLPPSVRREVVASVNAAQMAKGNTARLGAAFDCDGNGTPDLSE